MNTIKSIPLILSCDREASNMKHRTLVIRIWPLKVFIKVKSVACIVHTMTIHGPGGHQLHYFNSLTPSDAIWWHGSWLTLVQVMACCLTAPSHNLDHCWLGNIGFHPRPDAQENHQIKVPKFASENHCCKQFLILARGQWVKHKKNNVPYEHWVVQMHVGQGHNR